MSRISVFLILSLEIVDLELQVVHLSEPPYQGCGVTWRLEIEKAMLVWIQSAPAPTRLHWWYPLGPAPVAQTKAPALSSAYTCLSGTPWGYLTVLRPRLISSSVVFLMASLLEPLFLFTMFYLRILSSLFILRGPHKIDLPFGISSCHTSSSGEKLCELRLCERNSSWRETCVLMKGTSQCFMSVL